MTAPPFEYATHVIHQGDGRLRRADLEAVLSERSAAGWRLVHLQLDARLTGENDGRVDPYNSRKMAARLQAATSSGRPVLLRTSLDTGHGIGTSLATRIEQDADLNAFLMEQLGMQPR